MARPTTTGPTAAKAESFSVVEYYVSILEKDEGLAMPVAAVECLAECVSRSTASTMQELVHNLMGSVEELKSRSKNAVSLTAGCDLFLRYLTSQSPPLDVSFSTHKKDVVNRAREFVKGSKACVARVAEAAAGFVEDGATVMAHGCSRVVVQALVFAATREKKRLQVFVTESRPFGLGVKMQSIMAQHGIPCCVILDSAVSYTMAKCDLVVVGAEGVVENGGLINYIGGYQMAIAAKAHGKPLYALAESYKFIRLFPLSQYDLPTTSPALRFPSDLDPPPASASSASSGGGGGGGGGVLPRQILIDSPVPRPLEMSAESVANNPLLDYTTPDLVSLVISDVGVLTPPGVSDALLASEGFFRR